MRFSAFLNNSPDGQHILLKVGETAQSLSIVPRPSGGSSTTGGELLFLALATCFCNDIYREAARSGITVQGVEVEVDGDFEAPGVPAKDICYRAKVQAEASEVRIRELILHVDSIAEIHNTLRVGTQ